MYLVLQAYPDICNAILSGSIGSPVGLFFESRCPTQEITFNNQNAVHKIAVDRALINVPEIRITSIFAGYNTVFPNPSTSLRFLMLKSTSILDHKFGK